MSRGKKENILQPYDFNHKREYLIYLNACGKKLNKKESVLIGKDRFSTYEQWSEYVRGKYSCISTGSLESFLRYLRYLLRSAMKVESSYSGVIMPIMIVLLTFILGNLFQNDAINNLVCIALIFWFLCYCINAFTNDSKRLLLYEDYIEIIEGILESRKISESNQILVIH